MKPSTCILAAALSLTASAYPMPWLIESKQPFVNPDIPTNMIVEELRLTPNQINGLENAITHYRTMRRDLSPGYENRHRTILQGPQATDPAMIKVIIQSGQEIAEMLSANQLKKVPTLTAHAEAVASIGYPLAAWELMEYTPEQQNKIFAAGSNTAGKLRNLADGAPKSSRDAIVLEGWNRLKRILTPDEFETLVRQMEGHHIPIPGR